MLLLFVCILCYIPLETILHICRRRSCRYLCICSAPTALEQGGASAVTLGGASAVTLGGASAVTLGGASAVTLGLSLISSGGMPQ